MKHLTRIALYFFLLSSPFLFTSFSPPPARISMKMEAKSLAKGKAMVIYAEIYYQYDQGRMLTRYLPPNDYLFITNAKGEAKVYYPTTNEVFSRQSAEFDSEKSLLYFFLSNKIADLGLKDMGFKITDTRFEEGLAITTWFPPGELLKFYSKVELVHENYKPIYIAYFDDKGKIQKKIFYYEYSSQPGFVLPQKVTEITYTPAGDSVISKLTYSDIRVGEKANSHYFNFKIPVNAKVRE